jgi:predicted Zn finger-like uncharacterized protein
MTDSFVTQCPHCQTSFRVSHAQLSVARGVVRCGSCLQVFNAAKQLLEQHAGKDAVTPVAPPLAELPVEASPNSAAPPVVESPAIEPAAPRATSQKQWSASALDLDSLDLDEELARLEQREIQPATELGRPREESLSARRDSPEPDDAAWPGSLFSEPADERIPEPDDEPQVDDIEPLTRERTEPSLSLEPVDLDDEPAIPHLRLHDPIDPNARRERVSASDEVDADLPSIEPLRKKRERAEPGVRAEVLQDLTDDPLQLDWQKRRSPWGRRLLWLLLVLLAAGGWLASTSLITSMSWRARINIARGSSKSARRSAARCRPRSTSPESKAAIWWCAAIRSSAARWWSMRSSTTVRRSPSRFHCWNCASPT